MRENCTDKDANENGGDIGHVRELGEEKRADEEAGKFQADFKCKAVSEGRSKAYPESHGTLLNG